MLFVNCTMYQDKIKDCVLESFPEVKFVNKTMLNLQFETPNDSEYLDKVKKVIKHNPEFAAVYFNLEVK